MADSSWQWLQGADDLSEPSSAWGRPDLSPVWSYQWQIVPDQFDCLVCGDDRWEQWILHTLALARCLTWSLNSQDTDDSSGKLARLPADRVEISSTNPTGGQLLVASFWYLASLYSSTGETVRSHLLSHFGLLSSRDGSTYWSKSRGGPQRWLGV